MVRAFLDYLSQLKGNGDGTFNGMLSAKLRGCDYEKRWLELAIETKSWMSNPDGVVHGGVSAAMLDMTMGLLCRYFSGGGMAPTVSLQMNYLRPVPVDAVICLRAELTKRGFSLCHATGSAWIDGAPDKILCTSTGVFFANNP